MPRSKIAISLDALLLERLDRLVKEEVFPNRSQAIQAAIEEKLARVEKGSWLASVPSSIPCSKKPYLKKGLAQIIHERS